MIESYRSDFHLSEEESVSEAMEELRIRGIAVDRNMLSTLTTTRQQASTSPLNTLIVAINNRAKESVHAQLETLRASPRGVQQLLREGISTAHAHVILNGALSVLDDSADCHFLLRVLKGKGD